MRVAAERGPAQRIRSAATRMKRRSRSSAVGPCWSARCRSGPAPCRWTRPRRWSDRPIRARAGPGCVSRGQTSGRQHGVLQQGGRAALDAQDPGVGVVVRRAGLSGGAQRQPVRVAGPPAQLGRRQVRDHAPRPVRRPGPGSRESRSTPTAAPGATGPGSRSASARRPGPEPCRCCRWPARCGVLRARRPGGEQVQDQRVGVTAEVGARAGAVTTAPTSRTVAGRGAVDDVTVSPFSSLPTSPDLAGVHDQAARRPRLRPGTARPSARPDGGPGPTGGHR